LKGTIPSSLRSLTKLTSIYLAENSLTGLVPSLPFKQYYNNSNNNCYLDDAVDCTEPNCNHFKCPLPAGSEQCKDGPGGTAGVHCHSGILPCTGSSRNLNAVSCAAWQDLAKATNIAGWIDCRGNLLDPCSCKPKNAAGVTCADGDITALGLGVNNLEGTIPSSLGSLTKLTYISLEDNSLTGLVPPLPFKQYSYWCSLDAPDSCPGPGFCNHFKCPLPAGSEQCKANGGVGVHCK
jgi:hypothetical protein